MTISENAGPFERAIRFHDWYYDYSDDYGVWRRGRARHQALDSQRKQLECPFSLLELRCWAENGILEDYEEREPGKFYHKENHPSVIAPSQRSDLIPRARAEEIEKWMKKHDRASGTSDGTQARV